MTDLFGPHTAEMTYMEREVMHALAGQNKIIYPVADDSGEFLLSEHGPFNLSSKYNNSEELGLFSDGYIIPVDLVSLEKSPAHLNLCSDDCISKFYGHPDFIFYKPEEGFYFIDLKGFGQSNGINLAQLSPYNGKHLIENSPYLQRVIEEYTEKDEPLTLNSGCYIMHKGMPRKGRGVHKYIGENLETLIEGLEGLSIKSEGLIPNLEINLGKNFVSDLDYVAEPTESNGNIYRRIGLVKNQARFLDFYPVDFCVVSGFSGRLEPITLFTYSPRGIARTNYPELDHLKERREKYKNLQYDFYSEENFKQEYNNIISWLKNRHLKGIQNKIHSTKQALELAQDKYARRLRTGYELSMRGKRQHDILIRSISRAFNEIKENERLLKQYEMEYHRRLRQFREVAQKKWNRNAVYQKIEKMRLQDIEDMDKEIESKEKKKKRKQRKDGLYKKLAKSFRDRSIQLPNGTKVVEINDSTGFRLPRELYLNLNSNKAYRILMFESIRI